MPSLAWFVLALVYAISVSEAHAGEPADCGEAHKAIVTALFEDGWTRGDYSVFTDSFAEKIQFHYTDTERTVHREDLDGLVDAWRVAFPDLRVEVQGLVAEGDSVAARVTLRGTHTGGPWRGAEPTGNEVSMAVMFFFRFEDGRVVEFWEVDDQLGFREQLGLQ